MQGTPRRYRLATRLNSFLRGGRAVPDAIRAIGQVLGIDSLEINYPQHLEMIPEADLVALLAETRLTLTGVNLRFEGSGYHNGAFTSPEAATRERAIEVGREAVDLARRLGAGHVVLWMADDGFDYPLQVDAAE